MEALAEDPNDTSWKEVCKKVGFGENLYRECREKTPGFSGFSGGLSAGLSSFDEIPEEEDGGPDSAGFGAQLAASAQAA